MVDINKKQDELLADYAVGMLKDFYMRPSEKSPQEAYARAAEAWSKFDGKLDKELAQRIYEYASKKWFMFASPVLSNAPNGKPNEDKGMPISCFLTYVPDTLEGLISHSSELRWLSVYGGGVGGHWSDVRTISDVAPGPIPFLHTVDADMIAYRQGKTRKGSYAAYMDIRHPDILEFMQLRIPTGDVQRKALNIHNAVNLTDDFMEAVIKNEEWEFKDPSDNRVTDKMPARKVWQQLLETRFRTGEPYLNFIDTANKALPEPLKKAGLKINGSNLCNEIHLPTSEDRTAVCCLSSLNLEYYDDWKDTNIVQDLITMLDNVLEYFIKNAPNTIERAKFSAARERSLGLGAMGFHSYLQRKGCSWQTEVAREYNTNIFKTIKERANEQTELLAVQRGEYLDGHGSGKRNSHLLAIAPNASSGIILSTSPSIEPLKANAYTHRTRAGSFLVKNKYLQRLLESKKENKNGVWKSIITNKGSVQHLTFLSDEEKTLFKTADELDQRWVVQHSADRQQFICQGQSVNLFFPSGCDRSYVNDVHLKAWKEGLKGLYYLRTESKVRAETVANKVARVALVDNDRNVIYGKDDCPFCHMAKEEFRILGIPYDFINIEKLGKTAAEVTGRKDVKTVPQIYLKGEYVGGYDEFMLRINKGQEQNNDDECRACEG